MVRKNIVEVAAGVTLNEDFLVRQFVTVEECCAPVVWFCDAVDCLHDRRSDVRAEPCVLRGESVSYAGLWHVGTRQQVQQRLQRTACQVDHFSLCNRFSFFVNVAMVTDNLLA